MKKELEIIEIFNFDNDDLAWYHCNGHVDKQLFCISLKNQFNYDAKPEDIQHVWLRFYPGNSEFDKGWWVEYEPGRGGRKPVTMLSFL